MTTNDGAGWSGTEYAKAAAELREELAARIKRPVPPDLVVTTRSEIETREFRAYGQGWRDRGEHDERRRRQQAADISPRTHEDGAKVLPFPYSPRPPHLSEDARPHPSDDEPS